jgi:mono/diheme cytochrome c family protein
MPQFGRLISGRQVSRQMYRSLLHALPTLALLTVIVVVLAACAGVNDSGSHPDFVETQAAGHPEEGGHGAEGSPEAGGSPTAPATGSPAGGGEDLAATGQQLATTNGCTGCHSIDGAAGAGPTWQGLYGHEVTLSDGSTVTADDAYIAESIHDPSAQIVEGFSDIMPKTFADWSDDQVNAIIAYIKTLE